MFDDADIVIGIRVELPIMPEVIFHVLLGVPVMDKNGLVVLLGNA